MFANDYCDCERFIMEQCNAFIVMKHFLTKILNSPIWKLVLKNQFYRFSLIWNQETTLLFGTFQLRFVYPKSLLTR